MVSTWGRACPVGGCLHACCLGGRVGGMGMALLTVEVAPGPSPHPRVSRLLRVTCPLQQGCQGYFCASQMPSMGWRSLGMSVDGQAGGLRAMMAQCVLILFLLDQAGPLRHTGNTLSVLGTGMRPCHPKAQDRGLSPTCHPGCFPARATLPTGVTQPALPGFSLSVTPLGPLATGSTSPWSVDQGCQDPRGCGHTAIWGVGGSKCESPILRTVRAGSGLT